jgi:hypothetical protein
VKISSFEFIPSTVAEDVKKKKREKEAFMKLSG